ncbi:uncharacterized protein LOC128238868 isoform X2 [Mya arenaria]|uniref:uncharacterized protein LOC128238868 isoform X2 n=1 Tax=Mya arenaria TaxID=6604 RepID=UPI0022E3ADAC|nr:uncharacterized protein LOC128238868 isoform X2 [Mya arenaria]
MRHSFIVFQLLCGFYRPVFMTVVEHVFERKPSFDGFLCSQSSNNCVNKRNMQSCARECGRSEMCKSFFYDFDSRDCFIFETIFSDTNGCLNRNGHYYQLKGLTTASSMTTTTSTTRTIPITTPSTTTTPNTTTRTSITASTTTTHTSTTTSTPTSRSSTTPTTIMTSPNTTTTTTTSTTYSPTTSTTSTALITTIPSASTSTALVTTTTSIVTPCEITANCQANANLACIDDTCQCTDWLRYDPSSDMCLTDCPSSFGNTYTRRADKIMWTNIILLDILPTTLDNCFDQCSSDPACMGVNWNASGQRCKLKQEVSDSYYMDSTVWDWYTRNCF